MLNILLILIFVRPFISSLAFPGLNYIYSGVLLLYLCFWLLARRPDLAGIKVLIYPLALFCLALILSVIFSVDIANSLKELYKYTCGLLLLLTAASSNEEEKKTILKTLLSSAVVISIFAVYQYFLGLQHISDYLKRENIHSAFALDYIARRRVFFPFVTPNILGGYLAMIIPLAFTSGRKYWIALPLLLALILSGSLGALLSLLLAFVVYRYLRGGFSKKHLLYTAVLLMIILTALLVRGSMQGEHTQPIFSTTMRWNYWQETLAIIRSRPWTGIGIGNFNTTYARYAHNSYLQFWAETGIGGIIALLWINYAIFNSGLRKSAGGGGKNYLILGLLAADVSFVTHNLIDFTFFLPEVSLIWWLILGCILAPGLNNKNAEIRMA